MALDYFYIYTKKEQEELHEKIKDLLNKPILEEEIYYPINHAIFSDKKLFINDPNLKKYNLNEVIHGFSWKYPTIYNLETSINRQNKLISASNVLWFLSSNYLPWKYYPLKNKEKTLKQLENFILDDFNNEDLWIKKENGSYFPSLLTINVLNKFLDDLNNELVLNVTNVLYFFNTQSRKLKNYLKNDVDTRNVYNASNHINEFYNYLEHTRGLVLVQTEKLININAKIEMIYKLKHYLRLKDGKIPEFSLWQSELNTLLKQCDAFLCLYDEFKIKNVFYEERLNALIEEKFANNDDLKIDLINDNDTSFKKPRLYFYTDNFYVYNLNTMHRMKASRNVYDETQINEIIQYINEFYEGFKQINPYRDIYSSYLNKFYYTLQINLNLLLSSSFNFKILASLLDGWLDNIYQISVSNIKNQNYKEVNNLIQFLNDTLKRDNVFSYNNDFYNNSLLIEKRLLKIKNDLNIDKNEKYALSFIAPWHPIYENIFLKQEQDKTNKKNKKINLNYLHYHLASNLFKNLKNDFDYQIISKTDLLSTELNVLEEYTNDVRTKLKQAQTQKNNLSVLGDDLKTSLTDATKEVHTQLTKTIQFLKNVYGSDFNPDTDLFVYDNKNNVYYDADQLKDNEEIIETALKNKLDYYKANMILALINNRAYLCLDYNNQTLQEDLQENKKIRR